MIMRDMKLPPSEINDMTYPEMLLEVMRSLDPQRNPNKKPEETSPYEDMDDEQYLRTLKAMSGQ